MYIYVSLSSLSLRRADREKSLSRGEHKHSRKRGGFLLRQRASAPDVADTRTKWSTHARMHASMHRTQACTHARTNARRSDYHWPTEHLYGRTWDTCRRRRAALVTLHTPSELARKTLEQPCRGSRRSALARRRRKLLHHVSQARVDSRYSKLQTRYSDSSLRTSVNFSAESQIRVSCNSRGQFWSNSKVEPGRFTWEVTSNELQLLIWDLETPEDMIFLDTNQIFIYLSDVF